MQTDIITFDCGGLIYKISKNSLIKIKNTFFTNLLEHNKTLTTYYLDRNGNIFKYIMYFYRNNTINIDDLHYSTIQDILIEAEYFNIQPLIDIIIANPYYLTKSISIELFKEHIYNKNREIKNATNAQLTDELNKLESNTIKAKEEYENTIIKNENLKSKIEMTKQKIENYKRNIVMDDITKDLETLKHLESNFFELEMSIKDNIYNSSKILYKLFYKINDKLDNLSSISTIQRPFKIDIKIAIDYDYYTSTLKNYDFNKMYIVYDLFRAAIAETPTYNMVDIFMYICKQFHMGYSKIDEIKKSQINKIKFDNSLIRYYFFNKTNYNNLVKDNNIRNNNYVNFINFLKNNKNYCDEYITQLDNFNMFINEFTYDNIFKIKKQMMDYICAECNNIKDIEILVNYIFNTIRKTFQSINNLLNFDYIISYIKSNVCENYYIRQIILYISNINISNIPNYNAIQPFIIEENNTKYTYTTDDIDKIITAHKKYVVENKIAIIKHISGIVNAIEKDTLKKCELDIAKLTFPFDFVIDYAEPPNYEMHELFKNIEAEYSKYITYFEKFLGNIEYTLEDCFKYDICINPQKYNIKTDNITGLNNYQYLKKTYNISAKELLNMIFKFIPFQDNDGNTDKIIEFLDFIFECETNMFNFENDNRTLLNDKYYYMKTNGICNILVPNNYTLHFNSSTLQRDIYYTKIRILYEALNLINK